jgi:sulfonate transport system substrate-binding protein
MLARIRQRFWPVAVLSVVAVLITACGSAGKSAGGDVSDVSLTLGDQANQLQTLVTAAGVMKDAPYKFKWAEFQGAAPLFQAMQSGSVDTGTAADLPTLQALSGGLPIKLVAASTGTGATNGILVPQNSPIRTVADLKGKNVVVSSARGSIAEYLLAKSLLDNGLTYGDVKVQYVLPTAAQAAFSSGKIGVWAIFGIYRAIALQQGARQIVDGQAGRTSGIGFISAAGKTLADPAKKAALADFLKRLAKAFDWAAANLDAYATVYAQKNGVDPAVAKVFVTTTRSQLLPVTPDIVTKVQAVSVLMHGIGSLPTDVKVAPVVDTSAFGSAPSPSASASHQ